ncbi:MAG TPA: putative cytokinetic ring protein SteA [Acidimicrobiales bacterium]|nr:putative cytokinetic ring protein SteA [Acidimicrobiales bacterium]
MTADRSPDNAGRWFARAPKSDPAVVTAPARPGRRTKELVSQLRPGDIAVIDHEDLDPVAARSLLAAGVVGVVNAASFVSGRYPNRGPLVLAEAGVALLDGVGSAVLDEVVDGEPLTLAGTHLLRGDDRLASGHRQTVSSLGDAVDAARGSMGEALEEFAENTLAYLRREQHLLTDELDMPPLRTSMMGRQVLVVVRGVDYRDDLQVLRRSGYLAEMRPVLIGVDGGADALLEMGHRPDLIVGDFDSVSEAALRSGAELVVHAYRGGDAPGAARLDDMGLAYHRFEAEGTSEDIAMLMAHELGAELIVAVGTHSSMADFLDKGRAGMASTFLVRMKVGGILVDAKGVSRLYRHRVHKRDLAMLVLAALFTLAIIVWVSEPIRLIIRGYRLTF